MSILPSKSCKFGTIGEPLPEDASIGERQERVGAGRSESNLAGISVAVGRKETGSTAAYWMGSGGKGRSKELSCETDAVVGGQRSGYVLKSKR